MTAIKQGQRAMILLACLLTGCQALMGQKAIKVQTGDSYLTLHLELADSAMPYLLYLTAPADSGADISSDSVALSTFTLRTFTAAYQGLLGNEGLPLDSEDKAQAEIVTSDLYAELLNHVTQQSLLKGIQAANAAQQKTAAAKFTIKDTIPGYIHLPDPRSQKTKTYLCMLGVRGLLSDMERLGEVNQQLKAITNAENEQKTKQEALKALEDEAESLNSRFQKAQEEMASSQAFVQSEIISHKADKAKISNDNSIPKAQKAERLSSAQAAIEGAESQFQKLLDNHQRSLDEHKAWQAEADAKIQEAKKALTKATAAAKKVSAEKGELEKERTSILERFPGEYGLVIATLNQFYPKKWWQAKEAKEAKLLEPTFDSAAYNKHSSPIHSHAKTGAETLLEYFNKSVKGDLQKLNNGLSASIGRRWDKVNVENDYSGIFQDANATPGQLLHDAYQFDDLVVKAAKVETEDGYITEVMITAEWQKDSFVFATKYPLPVRTAQQQSRIYDAKLHCKEDKECFVYLKDVLRMSTQDAANRRDKVPDDSTYVIQPGKTVSAPALPIRHYLEVKVFNDAMGLVNGEEPNGLIQTEGRFNLPVSSRVFTGKYSKAMFTPLKMAHAELAITKLESNERTLDVQTFDTVDSSSSLTLDSTTFIQQPGKFVSTFGFFHYSFLRAGASLDLLDVAGADGLFRLTLSSGVHLFGTKLRDSTVTTSMTVNPGDSASGPDTTYSRSVAYRQTSVFSPTWMLEAKVRLQPSSRFYADFALRGTFLYFRNKDYKTGYGDETGMQLTQEQATVAKEKLEGPERILAPNLVVNPWIEVYWNPGPAKSDRNNMVYFRAAYFTNFDSRNSFFQLQAGYKIDLFTK